MSSIKLSEPGVSRAMRAEGNGEGGGVAVSWRGGRGHGAASERNPRRSEATMKALRVFSSSAKRYDVLNSIMSFGLDRYWRAALIRAAQLSGVEKILDVGTGTGALMFDIHKRFPQCNIVGIDPVPEMLAVARDIANVRSWNLHLTFQEGIAEALPFPDATFDRIVTAFTLRNFTDRAAAFRECVRALKPGGKFISLELTRPKNAILRTLHRWYVQGTIPLFGKFFSDPKSYEYLARTVLTFPEPEEIAVELKDAGFQGVAIRPLNAGITTLHIAS